MASVRNGVVGQGLRVLIAAGGSGGHVFPGLALGRTLTERDPTAMVRFAGTSRGIESRAVPEAGFPIDLLPILPLFRRLAAETVAAPFAAVRGVLADRGARCRRAGPGHDRVGSWNVAISAMWTSIPVRDMLAHITTNEKTTMLEPNEKEIVFRHACAWFPGLVPAGAKSFDDLLLLDRTRARPWYGHPVEGSRSFSSTGTSGYPKPIAWTPEEDAWYVGEKRGLFAAFLAGCTRAFISLAVGHNASSAHNVLGQLGLEVHDAGLSALDHQCAVITQFAPEVLYCSPSILASLISGMDRRGQRPTSVRRIITNGEVLFPSARERAQRFFGIGRADLMDTYGSTEIGTIAHSCGACGSYHFLKGLYPEAAPAEEAEAEEPIGEPGTTALALSSVKRTSFPVVRLVTYDLVRGLRRGVCGGMSRFTCDRILGRCDDVLNYGELFSSYDLGDLIGARLPAARWFVFNPNNDVTIVIEGTEPAGFREELRSRYPLHSRMSDLGLLDPPEIRFVGDFDAFVARAGLPTPGRGKAVSPVQRRVPESSWFVEEAAL